MIATRDGLVTLEPGLEALIAECVALTGSTDGGCPAEIVQSATKMCAVRTRIQQVGPGGVVANDAPCASGGVPSVPGSSYAPVDECGV